MPKTIQERVRAALEKKERDERRAADKAHDARERKAEKFDADYERGVLAFERDGQLPANANKRMQEGFRAAALSEFAYD